MALGTVAFLQRHLFTCSPDKPIEMLQGHEAIAKEMFHYPGESRHLMAFMQPGQGRRDTSAESACLQNLPEDLLLAHANRKNEKNRTASQVIYEENTGSSVA